jgi:hypothetical protein
MDPDEVRQIAALVQSQIPELTGFVSFNGLQVAAGWLSSCFCVYGKIRRSRDGAKTSASTQPLDRAYVVCCFGD